MDRFTLPCTLTPKEAAAIERRRRIEEERKARIFDPKTRTLGVRTKSFPIIFNSL